MTIALADFLSAAGHPELAAGQAPRLAATAWADELLTGYTTDPVSTLLPAWDDHAGELVCVTEIAFVSGCAHHMLPFFGRAHVGYLPGTQLTGLSRIEELVRCLSRRWQLQERLGEEIVETIMAAIDARGAACVIEAEHLCAFARGNRQRGAVTRTFAFRGALHEDRQLQERCLRWFERGNQGPTLAQD